MDALVAIDTLDDLAHSAPRTPIRDQLTFDRDELAAAIRQARRALEAGYPAAAAYMAADLEALERLPAEAKTVLLSGRVRVPAGAIMDPLDRIRAALPRHPPRTP